MNIRLISTCSLAAALSISASAPLSAAIQNPKPISQVAPAYSFDLRSADVEGEVVVGFTISKTGEVLNPVVVSTTDRYLDKAAVAAVRKWRFAPATNDGVAVSVRAVQPIKFEIAELHTYTAVQLAVSKRASQARNASNAN
jgi:protein TonB